MKTTKITKTVELKNGLLVNYTISKNGQASPEVSDNLITKVCLCLPANEGNNHLHNELQFSNRLRVVGEHLNYDWGNFNDNSKTRNRIETITTETYSEGFRIAEEFVLKQIANIDDLISQRMEALRIGDDI